MPCEVQDVLVVPDYERYLGKHLATVERFAKTQWTQLQFFFDEVNDTANYPFNVKMTYRKYSADRVAQIIKDDSHSTGLNVQNVDVFTYPQNINDGLYMLKSMPSGNLIPEGFIEGSRAFLDTFLNNVKRKYTGNTMKFIVDEWEKWCRDVALR
jgi:hypothetical protein